MKILFFTHYFPPEVNAPATRTYEHCRLWAAAGHEVTVVTCAPNCPDGVVYEGYRNAFWPQYDVVDGIRVVRVWTLLAANAGTLRRILNFLSYLCSAVFVSLRLSRPDVVVATSPQFFCGWAGVLVSWIKRRPFVLEIRDIWPESIAAVGALKSRSLLRFLELLERRLYLAADHIVAVGDGYREKILEKVAVGDRVSVITNGVDLRSLVPSPPDASFLHMWDLEEKFVCSYIGTIGMAHGLDVVIDAAEMLREKRRDDVSFLLVGDGARRAGLEQEVRRRGLERHVMFTGRQPREEVPRILASSNACLIHLKECDLFETVIPSKIFETMAMGRPIIMGVKGQAREIVLDADAGLVMQPGSAKALVECIEQISRDSELALRLGQSARAYVADHFSRPQLASRFLHLLHTVADIEETTPVEEVPTAAPSLVQTPATHT